MGAVFSLPCFRRQRRRRHTLGASSSSTTIPTRTVTISHPRPLGSVLPSGHSVHGGGPSSGGPSGGGGALSSSRSTTTSQGDRERRGLLNLNMSMGGFSQLVTLGMLDNGTRPAGEGPSKRLLEVVESSRASSDDTHGTNNTAGTGVASGSSGSTTLVDTMSSSSSGANLLHGLSQATSCCSESPSASPDASPSVSRSPSQRNMLRSSSSRVRSPGHKHSNSYSRNRSRSGRSRPRSYPSTHYGSDNLKDRPSSPSARRRTLRKIRRVDNGWDYIRSADLDGFEARLGRNGNRVSILG